ncbi:MAG: GNAT family N-acetyltransferase [Rhodospirillales bacterium]
MKPLPPPREDGMMDVTITSLEMTAPPSAPPPPRPAEKLALLRLETPGVPFYRFLYNAVGGPWLWWERRAMSDEDLLAVIRDENVEIEVLYIGGAPAGYFELDRRRAGEVELAYFGLMPEFTGRRIGPFLLRAAVDQAWTKGAPKRLWVHTCNLDSPKALPVYQRAGFAPCGQETVRQPDPRVGGLF